MILRPFGSVGTLMETQQLHRMETKCPVLSLPQCLGGKGCRSEFRGWQQFTELLLYLVTIVLNYGFPSVLGEASTSQICSTLPLPENHGSVKWGNFTTVSLTNAILFQ